MFFLNASDPVTLKALEVASVLDEWVKENAPAENSLGTGVFISDGLINITIGSCVAWSSSTDSVEQLSVDFCIDEFRKEAEEAMALFQSPERQV